MNPGGDVTTPQDVREAAKGPLLLALHDLNVRIAGLRPDEPDLCHCGLVAEVALDAVLPAVLAAVEPVIRQQVAEDAAALQRVRALHSAELCGDCPPGQQHYVCAGCGPAVDHPCVTAITAAGGLPVGTRVRVGMSPEVWQGGEIAAVALAASGVVWEYDVRLQDGEIVTAQPRYVSSPTTPDRRPIAYIAGGTSYSPADVTVVYPEAARPCTFYEHGGCHGSCVGRYCAANDGNLWTAADEAQDDAAAIARSHSTRTEQDHG